MFQCSKCEGIVEPTKKQMQAVFNKNAIFRVKCPGLKCQGPDTSNSAYVFKSSGQYECVPLDMPEAMVVIGQYKKCNWNIEHNFIKGKIEKHPYDPSPSEIIARVRAVKKFSSLVQNSKAT